MNLLPAIVLGGPPHAGKSVLFYNLTKALHERGIVHHAIRACPDGEGNWFQEFDQNKVRLLQIRGEWSDTFLQRICLDLERRHLPLLVDLGGRPTERETRLFCNCTHSLLLLHADQEDNTAFWRDLMKTYGLLPLAELYSQLDGPSRLDTDESVIKGTIAGLERGSLVSGRLFDALVERIALLFGSYSFEELEQANLNMAPTELVVDLKTLLQRWTPGNVQWERTMLPRLLAELPAETPLSVYGRGPNWIYGALAAHSGQQPFYQFDPRLGWISPPPLLLDTATTPEIQTTLSLSGEDSVLSLRIFNSLLDYTQADHLSFPPVPSAQGIILNGPIPLWLMSALVRLYRQAGVAWIACHQIQLGGSVVVYSQLATFTPGDLVAYSPP